MSADVRLCMCLCMYVFLAVGVGGCRFVCVGLHLCLPCWVCVQDIGPKSDETNKDSQADSEVGSFSLVDHGEGSGGFIAIPGSHKANFPTPPSLIDGSGHQDLTGVVVQPTTKAGDVILFSEGTVHG